VERFPSHQRIRIGTILTDHQPSSVVFGNGGPYTRPYTVASKFWYYAVPEVIGFPEPFWLSTLPSRDKKAIKSITTEYFLHAQVVFAKIYCGVYAIWLRMPSRVRNTMRTAFVGYDAVPLSTKTFTCQNTLLQRSDSRMVGMRAMLSTLKRGPLLILVVRTYQQHGQAPSHRFSPTTASQ